MTYRAMTRARARWTRGWPWRWILFFIALSVRLIYILQGHEVPLQDTPDYDEIALNLLRGEGFVARQNWFGHEIRSWRPPFYPFFLASIYQVAGYGHMAVKVAQALVGAGTVVLVYELAGKLRPHIAPAAGLCAAFYGPLVASANEVMSETWFTFWTVLAAWQLVGAVISNKGYIVYCLAGGAAVGMAALTRPVALIFLPAFVLTAVLRHRCVGLCRSFWVVLALVVVVMPWTWRNYQVHGEWVPISTHGGFIVARSNAADPDWRRKRGWSIEKTFFEEIPAEVERDRHWYSQGMEFVLSNPDAYLRLAGERFLRFWYFLHPEYNFWLMSVLPFFLAGFYCYWSRGGFLLLSSFTALSVGLFTFVLYGSTRFRLPLEPFFILFAVAFLHQYLSSSSRTRIAASFIVCANTLLFFFDEGLRTLVLQILHGWGLR